MRKQRNILGVACAVMALAALSLAGSASAKLTGEYTKFANCPRTNPEVNKCIQSVTNSGEVILGTKKVPITNPVTLQGGFTTPVAEFSKFVAATNGITLSKAAQSVPGGLLGIVPPEKSPALVKLLSKFFFENALTGVNSTLELAKPASEIKISELHLGEEEEVALKLPVMLHLENPFLGKSCFVGSTSAPIYWELTTGFTAPPKPNESIRGFSGEFKFLDGGKILLLNNDKLVDNAWAAPSAVGCGGILGFLVNPIINGQIGLPSAAGKNTSILNNTVSLATAFGVEQNNLENP